MSFDNFPLTTLEEKRKLLPLAEEDQWLLFFEHDPYAELARVEPTAKGFRAGEPIPIEAAVEIGAE